MQYTLAYEEWSEEEKRELGRIASIRVDREGLAARKLANATLLRNRLYEHTSNEYDSAGVHTIYARRWQPQFGNGYGLAVERALLGGSCAVSDQARTEYYDWNGTAFERMPTVGMDQLEPSLALLDHYAVIGNVQYEVLYGVFDADRNTAAIFLRKAELCNE